MPHPENSVGPPPQSPATPPGRRTASYWSASTALADTAVCPALRGNCGRAYGPPPTGSDRPWVLLLWAAQGGA